jgi:hypothetical protein
MTASVGTISVAFTGDTSKVDAAFAKMKASLGGVSAATEKMRAALGATKYAAADVGAAGDAMKRAGDKGAAALGKLTPAAERATAKLASLRDHAGALDDKTGKLQNAIGGLSSAFGVAGGRVGDMVGGVADLAMSFSAGGPLMVALLAVGVAVAAVVGHFTDIDKAAKKAADEAAKNLQHLKQEVSDLYDEINALGSGRLLDEVRLQTQIEAKLTAIVEAVPIEGRSAFDAYSKSTSFRDPSVESVPHFATARALMLELFELENKLHQVRTKAAQEEIAALEKEHFGTDKPKVGGAAGAAEAPMTKSEQIDAVRDMFAGMKDQAIVKASFANPTITGDEANRLAGMEVEGPMMVLSEAVTATADDIAAMNADFLDAGAAAIDLRSPFEKLGDAALSVAGTLAQAATDVIAATLQGGAQGGGAALGGMVGGIVDVATGGATGGLGTVLGSLIGGVLGKALDALAEALNVLTPLFDGVAVVIKALQPILLVVKVLMGAVGMVLEMLSPIIMDLARPIAALALVVVRIVEALVPFIGIVLGSVHGLVVFLDVLTMGVKWLDDNFFRPMVSGSRALYNAFVDLVNYIVGWFRMLPGMEEFGTLMQRVGTYVPPIIDTFADDMTDAAEAAAAFADEETNIPTGYRVPYYDAETPDGRGNNTAEGPGRPTGDVWNIGTLNMTLADEAIASAIRRKTMTEHGKTRHIPRGNAPSRSN